MIRARRLTPGEVELAQGVFGQAVDCARVRLLVLPWGAWAVTLGSLILFPQRAGLPTDFSAERLSMQAWFIHEMAHVWQFQTASLRTLLSWAKTVLSGGYGPGQPGYRYDLPLPDWRGLNLEQQASAIEHAFLLSRGVRTGAMPAGAAPARYRSIPVALCGGQ